MPQLPLAADLKNRLNDAEISRVVMSHDKKAVSVCLKLYNLITRREQSILEGTIKASYFKNNDAIVHVIPEFDLGDVPADEIFEKYDQSVRQEMKENDLMLYSVYNAANTQTDSTTIHIELDPGSSDFFDVKKLQDFIEDIYNKRLGLKIKIEVNLEKKAPQRVARSPRGSGNAEPRFKKRGKRLLASEGYGNDFNATPMPISEISEEMGEVVIEGKVFAFDERLLKNGSTLFTFGVYDGTDSIMVKLFAKEGREEEPREVLSGNPTVLVYGEAVYDKFDGEVVMRGIKGIKIVPGKSFDKRKDDAEEKRVELHLHTKSSEMDAVSSVEDLIDRAVGFGHKAVAITDHGVVHSFPSAMHAADGWAKKGKPIKIIYGCEGYLVDDRPGCELRDILSAPRYHIIILAKNDTGKRNLYKLVSESHLKYFSKRPRIPRSLIEQNREGLIIGSACEAGEVIRGIVTGVEPEELERRVKFYDYLEIQPIGNNEFLKRSPSFPDIRTDEDLRDINRKVVELGETYNKPVAATCDVHFKNPEDEIYRRIIMAGMGYSDADMQPPLFLRTTEEMLAEFDYLGMEKAREVVVETTGYIADCCDPIRPVRPDRCPPAIEGSVESLRTISIGKAKSLYGEPLPDIVKSRLEKELDSIINNEYSVMYVFAQMLVKKSNEDGYMVGSRGSVGSSFVATMMDITEVNPLPPHYRCPKCKYSEFDSEEIRKNAGNTGIDLPDKVCPKCGAKLEKDGIDIPFETFLGFNGTKEPDIDLNFSGEYQQKAHNYTAELFGDGYTFKAGTISTVADKTAYGFIKKYFEERHINKRKCEIERLVGGCKDVKRSTGQHPGGIIVLPKGEDIYSFTPIQHPANDMKSDIVTTHFDYHAIDQNLLKFDILGHDDPTMMKWLGDLSGIDPRTVPIDDPQLYKLLEGTEPLGIKAEDIGGTELGTLGIPEFNTDFAMEMLKDAKPRNFADLVNVAGLAHGTDVWMGNAKDLIKSGTATLQTAICTRDGIMLYLISKGLEASEAFDIMEAVRKGKVAKKAAPLWDKWKEDMLGHGVPEWYIGSCEKIKYMFPKAHAAAYVMMALRVAYFKIYYPREFYAAYFGIRAKAFDYEKMAMGKEVIERNLEHFRSLCPGKPDSEVAKSDMLSDIDRNTFSDLRICEEMYARGIEFAPIDLYTADAEKFKVVKGKIMPSFVGISGMGEKAARSLCDEAAKAKFLSKEDIISRAKISGTLADALERLGILGDMPQSNQLSLFDMVF